MGVASSDVSQLVTGCPERLPLIQAEMAERTEALNVRGLDATKLFPGARTSDAALAGLLLRMGCWDRSHQVAQDIDSPEGSYWHGILHRMEPDASNAKYWFRRVGTHAIFPELHRQATGILEANGPKQWTMKTIWEPMLFIDWCEEAVRLRGRAEVAALQIQLVEWQLLFDWCSAVASEPI